MWVTVDDCVWALAHTETHKLNTSCLCCLVWTPEGLKLVPDEAGTVRCSSTWSASSLRNSSGENCPRTVLFPQVVLPFTEVFSSKACGYIVGSIKAHQHVTVRQIPLISSTQSAVPSTTDTDHAKDKLKSVGLSTVDNSWKLADLVLQYEGVF